MLVGSKKKKIMKLGGDEQESQVTDKDELYEDIQNLQPERMQSKKVVVP